MYPHRIRLRHPWECEPLVQLGRVRFRRRFGYPGRIDAHERVWLTFTGLGGQAEVALNGQSLGRYDGASGPFEIEVTPLLRPRNELVVEVEGAEMGGPRGEVALEVRCTAFLRDLRRWAEVKGERADLHVSGRVVGVAERPLDLYIVLNRSPAAYQTVTAAADGQPFHVVVPDLPSAALAGSVVKVDLVNGAVVWYTSEEVVLLEPTSRPGK